MANTLDPRTRKLMETVSEIVDKQRDVGIFKLYKNAPEKVRAIQAARESLQNGSHNGQSVKKPIADILAERTVTDSKTGTPSIDLLGQNGKGFSSITEFSPDEIRSNLKALKERSKALQKELASLQATIEEKIVAKNPALVQANVDIRKDINLRNAMRRIFGDKKTSISFEDYKKVLELRTRFEKEEVEAAASDEVTL